MKKNDIDYSVPTITAHQVNQLYFFTRKHFVEHYDLQAELVDHLANGIEKAWEQNPTLSFDEALQAEFKKFGVFGFSDIVARRKADLQKQYHAFVWQHFKDFFTLPKLFFTASLIYILSVLLPFLGAYFIEFVLGFSTLVFFVLLFFLIRNKQKQKLEKRTSSKKWMMEDVIQNYGGSACFFYLPIQIIFQIKLVIQAQNTLVVVFVSAFLICWLLYSYIMIFVIPKQAHIYLNRIYPEYKLMV